MCVKERMEKMEREHSAQLAEMERKHGKETQDLKVNKTIITLQTNFFFVLCARVSYKFSD